MSGRWQWIAPDNWPPPPKDWAPYPGWQPDPGWPAPPAGHQFWKRRRRSRLGVTMVVITCVAAAAIFGTFIAAVSSLGYCAFDPPPGDVAPMTLTNDLTGVVSFEECLDSQCTRGDGVSASGSGPVARGAGMEWNHELCSEESVGVVDSNGHLLGCLVLPVEDPAKVTHFYASAAAPCR